MKAVNKYTHGDQHLLRKSYKGDKERAVDKPIKADRIKMYQAMYEAGLPIFDYVKDTADD